MYNPRDTAIIFGVLTLFHLLGGAALGAGLAGRRRLPVAWGLLLGGGPLYFGVERGLALGSWLPLVWQVAVLVGCALFVGLAQNSRLRAFFLRPGAERMMSGTFIMAAAAVLAAWLERQDAAFAAQIIGGIGFLFGAMWFGAGIKQLRGK